MNATVSKELSRLPARIKVVRVVESRYGDQFSGNSADRPEILGAQSVPTKPLSWDDRRSGVDIVQTTDGETIRLVSDGSQSVPQPGWVIMLTKGDRVSGFAWTLYGIPAA